MVSDENISKLLMQNKTIVKQIASIKNDFIDSIYFFIYVVN